MDFFFIEFYSGENHLGTRSLRSTIAADAEREARSLLAASEPSIDKVSLFEKIGKNGDYKISISYLRPAKIHP